MNSVLIYCIALHISAIVGIIYYSQLNDNYYKKFSVYLFVILILDRYTSKFYRLLSDEQLVMGILSSYYVNYLVIPLEYFFISWFYYKRLDNYKLLIKIGTFIYLASWVIEIFNRFGTGHLYFFTYSYQIGALWLLILALVYFIELMKSNRIIDFYKERFFYVSLGIIIFYVFTLPIHVFRNKIKTSDNSFIHDLYDTLSYPLNSIMYLLFAASFIWGKRN